MRVAGGLTLLFGLGLFTGVAYALTRKEQTSPPQLPKPPLPAPPPPSPASPAAPGPDLILQQLRQLQAAAPPQPVSAPIMREEELVRAVIPINIPTLDDNLTIDEIDAVAYALAREEDPRLLLQFAETFFPEHVVTASLLMAKAKLLYQPQNVQLRAAVEDAVRKPINLTVLAQAILPEFRAASDLLLARAALLKGTSPMSGSWS